MEEGEEEEEAPTSLGARLYKPVCRCFIRVLMADIMDCIDLPTLLVKP